MPTTSLPVYALLFAVHLRNSLPTLLAGGVPPDLGYGGKASPFLQTLQIVCLAYLWVLYAWALWRWKHVRPTRTIVVWTVTVLTVAAWALLPANSSDVLDYIGFGRLAAIYHVSPYLHTYSEVDDWFSPYVTWDDPMPYGPVTLPVVAMAGAVSQQHLLLAIYAMKAVWAVIHLLNAWLVSILARLMMVDVGYAVFLFACNPLILLELAGNGHNDGLLILFTLLALIAVHRGRYSMGVWLAFLGALVKISGLVWLGGILVFLLHRRQWRSLAWGLGATAVTLGSTLVLFHGVTNSVWVVSSQWRYSDDSLHTLVIAAAGTIASSLRHAWEYEDVLRFDRLFFSALFASFCVWRVLAMREVTSLVRELGHILLLLLLVFASSVQPWYLTWLLAIAAVTGDVRMRRTILVASASVLALYAFPFKLVDPPSSHPWWAGMRLALAFGAPMMWWMLDASRVAPAWVRSTSPLEVLDADGLSACQPPPNVRIEERAPGDGLVAREPIHEVLGDL